MAGGRGAFIVFEGVDRSGKSTQSEQIVQKLNDQGVTAELWRFPDRSSPTGKMIDAYLKSESELDDAAVHLLFSANRWEKKQLLLSKLQDGVTLVVDRYAYSGAVFTAAKQIPGLDLAWCKMPDRGLPAPDAVLYLELTIEEARQRGGFGQERYEKEDLQLKVRHLYGTLKHSVPGWVTLNAAQSVEDLGTQIEEMTSRIINECRQKPRSVGAVWSDLTS